MAKQPIIDQIYEAWDWHLEDALKRANSILLQMEKEFRYNGIKPQEYQPYVKQKFYELIQKVDG